MQMRDVDIEIVYIQQRHWCGTCLTMIITETVMEEEGIQCWVTEGRGKEEGAGQGYLYTRSFTNPHPDGALWVRSDVVHDFPCTKALTKREVVECLVFRACVGSGNCNAAVQ